MPTPEPLPGTSAQLPLVAGSADTSRRIRKTLLLAVTLAGITVACLSPARVRTDTRFWGLVFDVGHIPMWAWLAAALLYSLPERVRPGARRQAWAFALALGCAVLVEGLQPHFGRSGSVGDVVNDALGAGLALAGLAAWRGPAGWRWRAAHALAVGGVFAVALWPVYEEWRGLRWRQVNFPILGHFEDAAELKLWSAQGGARGRPSHVALTRAAAAQGEQSLRVVGAAGDWAGVAYAAGRQDWTPFRALLLEVFNPREPFTLFVRVDDDGPAGTAAGRLERGFELARGWNRLRLPLTEPDQGAPRRPVNLKAVRRLAIFTGDGEPQRFWFLDNVHLERRGSD